MSHVAFYRTRLQDRITVIRLSFSSVPCRFVTSIIKRFLIDITDEAAISEIFNIILTFILFTYYEVTGYFFYHTSDFTNISVICMQVICMHKHCLS